jgi:RNA polymerase sigma factor (sigma-70 family)
VTHTRADEHDDDDVFTASYREHYGALVRVAYLLTGSREGAEDAVHDTFLRCRSRLDTLEDPRSYLRAAVVNECRSVHRRLRRSPPVPTTAEPRPPAELVELQDALDRLPYAQRAAIVLRYFVDVPDDAIAAALGCRPATVRSHLRRGIANLREALA